MILLVGEHSWPDDERRSRVCCDRLVLLLLWLQFRFNDPCVHIGSICMLISSSWRRALNGESWVVFVAVASDDASSGAWIGMSKLLDCRAYGDK